MSDKSNKIEVENQVEEMGEEIMEGGEGLTAAKLMNNEEAPDFEPEIVQEP